MKLYKYRAWDDYARAILERREFWASCPDQLNDPFECKVRFDDHISRDDFRGKIYRIDQFHAEYAQRVSKIGVISFSARWNSVVMWSHYADQHRGVCIEVDVPTAGSVLCRPVRYERERPRINLFRDGASAHELAALVKNSDWSYEDEWRYTLEGSEQSGPLPCAVQFPEGWVTSVIVGARSAAKTRGEVATLLARITPAPRSTRRFPISTGSKWTDVNLAVADTAKRSTVAAPERLRRSLPRRATPL